VPWNAILPGLLLLGLVIFVHELGHFLMAKWRKVRVLRFSLGFGPALLKFTRGETEYRLAWIPFGGYVQMAGDSPAVDGTMPENQDEFLSHPWYGRLLIAIAGPAANLVTAFLVMVLVGLVGVSYPDYPNRLGQTPDTSVAARLGLREGDAIVAVGAQPVSSWVQIFVTNSRAPKREPIELQVARDGQTFPVRLTPEQREPFFSSLRRPSDPPVVGSVVTGMPAYKAGLKEGDRILKVNGAPIASWDELPRALRGTVDRPVALEVRRGDQTFDVTVTPINPEGRDAENARIGIEAPRHGTYIERYSPPQALEMGFRATGALVASVYGGMWLTVSRPLYYREYVGGPIFIAQAASEQARRGLDSYLQFLAMINIAIMAFNLLPLPILDGGHILLALIEGLRHQAISARSYLRFQKVGLVLMTALFVLILANDPLRLVQRQRALDKAPTSAPQERQVAPP
jgi:regulator of sigma E protease